ncbi:tetratricopeptide repeat-containing sensor histidine kinase [Mangrovimonas spongiae]|uniref:histidine kinase n=1 Tax=Mangrovimonas spongiae TaxID=2494697 RepID=A0A3R9UUU6_9FLAO|nr:ATP-binding protein [Mangrovimonas spongiae]RSK40639.1 tetratricopeptide repeat protein [Mangrovimonas spongiae]
MKKLITVFALCYLFFGYSQTQKQDSLTVQLAFQNPDTLKVNTSIELIKVLYELKDYNKALKFISESEKLSNKLGYNLGVAKINYYKALIYTKKRDYLNAMDYYNKSKSIYVSLKDTLCIAQINNNIGLIEIERGHYNKGLQYSLSAIKEFEKRHLINDLHLAYNNLAKAYYSVNNYDKAIEFYSKALNIEQQKGLSGEINTLLRLAELYSKEREYRKSIEYYEKGLNSNALTDSLKGEIYPKLGGEYLQFNDYDKSSEYLLKGLKLNRNLNNKNGLLITLNNLGKLNLKRNYLRYAEGQLIEAKDIAITVDNKEEQLRNFKLLKALDSTNKNFDRAFVWQREFYQLKNKLNKQTPTQQAITQQEDTVVSDLFETDNTTIVPETTSSNTLDAHKEESNRFKLILYALLAALVIVSTFLVLIYLKRNSRIKYTRALENKNKKIELQNEAILEQANHLEEINKVKDKLFSIVSHDLKDSLTSIKGFIDLLKDGSVTHEEFQSLIPELSENANNASLLLFNLLNWSKSQMQALEPNPSLFDIQEVFEEKVHLLEHKLEKKSIRLQDKTLKDFVYADRSMVEIIIQNLLTNAIKFSKAGDIITISNHISDGKSIISISDTGVGISKENQDKLFKNTSFTTIGTQNEKGTGLGLTICKDLVELNHGKIWVESDLNIGSTFYIELPKSKPENGNGNTENLASMVSAN